MDHVGIQRDSIDRVGEPRGRQDIPAKHEPQRHEKQTMEAELARLQEELVRKTRLAAIGQVSASIAHDLRTPLGSIGNAVYLLRHRVEPGYPQLSGPLDVIDQEVRRADQIISNLLAMARCRPPRKRKVDLGTLISNTLSRTLVPPGVPVAVDIDPQPFFLRCDPDQLRQVLANLWENALQAVGVEGHCWIQVCHCGSEDIIRFHDDGHGIPNTIRETLFEPLVTTKAQGTGLGLTICRQIVESHGGVIEARSPLEGGAVIEVRLPVADLGENQ